MKKIIYISREGCPYCEAFSAQTWPEFQQWAKNQKIKTKQYHRARRDDENMYISTNNWPNNSFKEAYLMSQQCLVSSHPYIALFLDESNENNIVEFRNNRTLQNLQHFCGHRHLHGGFDMQQIRNKINNIVEFGNEIHSHTTLEDTNTSMLRSIELLDHEFYDYLRLKYTL